MPLLTRNKPLGKAIAPTKFRRLALGSWKEANDPTLYGMLEVNIEAALAYLEQQRTKTTEKLTITHYIGKVFAEILKLHPELNSEIRFGQFYPRQSIDLSFQIAIEDLPFEPKQHHRHDLSAGLVEQADQKSIIDIAKELNARARLIRGKDDPMFKGIKKISSIVPGFFLSGAVGLLKFFIRTLNLWSPVLGIPKNAFGGIMLTNVGSLGLDFALPALFPPAGVSCIIAVGAIYKAPHYETDAHGVVTKTTLKPYIRLCGAFDHRFIDGIHASRIARDIRRLIEHPEWIGEN